MAKVQNRELAAQIKSSSSFAVCQRVCLRLANHYLPILPIHNAGLSIAKLFALPCFDKWNRRHALDAIHFSAEVQRKEKSLLQQFTEFLPKNSFEPLSLEVSILDSILDSWSMTTGPKLPASRLNLRASKIYLIDGQSFSKKEMLPSEAFILF